MNIRGIVITGAAALALVAGGTAAGAVIAGPIDGSGVVHGCYYKPDNNGSSQVVLQDTSTTCPKNTTPITWNQTGPQGLKGDTGAIGPQGPQGAKGDTGSQGPPGQDGAGATVATEPAGNNCADGGAKITDGSGDTAYACTGATGPQGAAGPQGPAGVGTAGPSGLDIVQVDNFQLVDTNGIGDSVAFCPADHPYVIGGGGNWTEIPSGQIPGPILSTSEPFGTGAWRARGVNTSGELNNLEAWAICAK